MRIAVTVGLALVLGAATSGCGGSGSDIRRFDGDPPIFTFHGDGGMDAIVGGQLVYVEDEECIALENGGYRNAAVFPDGSDAYLEADGTLIVEMAGYGPLREGVWIEGGGGTVSSGEGSGRPAVPPGCATDGKSYAVLQQVMDVQLTAPAGD